MVARLTLLATLAVAATLTSCRRAAPAPPVAPLEVEVSGCAGLTADRVCELGSSRGLRVWVRSPESAGVVVKIDGVDRPAKATTVQGGVRLSLEIPEHGRELRVSSGTATAIVRLAARETDPLVDSLEDKRKRGASVDDAVDEGALASLPPRLRARALDVLARSDLAKGRAEAAAEKLERARRLHREGGALSGEIHDSFALAYTQILLLRRFAEARALLAETRDRTATYPDGRAELPYYEALLAAETGDVRAAFGALRASELDEGRLGRSEQLPLIERTRVLLLLDVGRYDEARARLATSRRDLPANAPPCQRAHVLTNVGWASLRVAEQRTELGAHDREAETEAESALRDAISLYERECPNAAFLSNARINLARSLLARGDVRGVAALVAQRDEKTEGSRTSVWWADLQGREALAEGKAREALSHFERAAVLAESAGLASASWRAEEGRGEALEAMGRASDSLSAYARAESLLDDQTLMIPMTEGRETFLSDRSRSARRLMDAHLRRGDVGRAFEAARKARARALSASRLGERTSSLSASQRTSLDDSLASYRRERGRLDEEAASDWKLSASRLDEVRAARKAEREQLSSSLDRAFAALGGRTAALPAMEPGELLLLAHPGREGVAIFAAIDSEVRVRTAPELALDATLFAPFDELIERAKRIRVLAYGPLKHVDVHALIWRGQPLGASKPVVYGVDVSREASPLRDGSALLVADPRGDLPSAQLEAAALLPRLSALLGAPPRLLLGHDATAATVSSAMQSAGLLHYAGHARFADSGWGSALLLEGDASLAVPDVLALSSAPSFVVLSGCETARTDDRVDVEAMGLSEAFILAGARSVVAATRPIDDRLAESFVRDLYADEVALDDVALALSRAESAARARDPSSDWAAFRVVVP